VLAAWRSFPLATGPRHWRWKVAPATVKVDDGSLHPEQIREFLESLEPAPTENPSETEK
jgi:hypothetical protein